MGARIREDDGLEANSLTTVVPAHAGIDFLFAVVDGNLAKIMAIATDD